MTDKQRLAEKALLEFAPTGGGSRLAIDILQSSSGGFGLEDLRDVAEHLNRRGYVRIAEGKADEVYYGLNDEGIPYRDSQK